MSDQKQDNEEYHYDDLGAYEPEFNTDNKTPQEDMSQVEENSVFGNPVIRNALIAIMVFIVLMAGYKIYTWFSAPKASQALVINTKPVVAEPATPPLETSLPKIENAPQVLAQPVQPVVEPLHPEVEQKLSNLETNQQSIRSNLSVVEGHMTDVSSTVTQLNQKLESMTQTLNTLNQKMDRQSQELDIINERTKPKPKPIVVRHVKAKPKAPPPVFYIQAIIPGRAWLTAPNGATITIREGSRISGYGLVRMIDAAQGRIVTSSGRVIRFSPADN